MHEMSFEGLELETLVVIPFRLGFSAGLVPEYHQSLSLEDLEMEQNWKIKSQYHH